MCKPYIRIPQFCLTSIYNICFLKESLILVLDLSCGVRILFALIKPTSIHQWPATLQTLVILDKKISPKKKNVLYTLVRYT